MVGSDIVGTEEGWAEFGLGRGDGVIEGGVFIGNELQLSFKLPTPLPLTLLLLLLLPLLLLLMLLLFIPFEFACEVDEKFDDCCKKVPLCRLQFLKLKT